MERGGKTLLEKELGVSHNTINSGIKELKSGNKSSLLSGLRKKGRDAEGVAIPYGISDQSNNKGWVNVGLTKDTAEFAVQIIRNWWYKMGIYYNNAANSLLITADGGGSH